MFLICALFTCCEGTVNSRPFTFKDPNHDLCFFGGFQAHRDGIEEFKAAKIVDCIRYIIDEMAAAPKGQALATGITIAGRMIRRIREERMCDGVHIMAIGKEERVPDIMAAADLPQGGAT